MAVKKIILLEDEQFLCDLVRGYLEKVGCEISAAPTAAEGLAKLRAEKPDLLILDRTLPDQNGFELYKTLRADFKTKSLPILLLTPGPHPGGEEKLREDPHADELLKPIKPRLLLQKTAKLLRIPVRYQINLPVTVSAAAGERGLPFRGDLLDLSETGARVQTSLKLAFNAGVRLQLQIPGQGPPLDLEGKILRVETGEGGTLSYGIRFTDPDRGHQERISRYLQSLPVKISF